MLYSSTTGIGQDLVLLHGWGFNSELFTILLIDIKINIALPKLTYLAMVEATKSMVDLMSGVMKLLKYYPTIQLYSAGH